MPNWRARLTSRFSLHYTREGLQLHYSHRGRQWVRNIFSMGLLSAHFVGAFIGTVPLLVGTSKKRLEIGIKGFVACAVVGAMGIVWAKSFAACLILSLVVAALSVLMILGAKPSRSKARRNEITPLFAVRLQLELLKTPENPHFLYCNINPFFLLLFVRCCCKSLFRKGI